MGPFYAEVCRKRPLPATISNAEGKVQLLPKVKRRGERGALAFLEEMTRRGTLVPGDVLVTDNEKCWKTDLVEAYLDDCGIQQIFYPTYMGAKLDPCDNSLHSLLRRKYDKRIVRLGLVGLRARIRILNRVYHSVPTSVIKGYVKHCGLFEGDPSHTITKLLSDGRRMARKRARSAVSHIFAYLSFKRANGFVERDETQAKKRLRQLPPAAT
jgi:hypothetical protein